MTVGAALGALAMTSACGGDKDSGGAGGAGLSADSGGPKGGGTGGGMPSAATMADIEAFVSQYPVCKDLYAEAKDPDADHPDDEAVGKMWGIKERAVCYNAHGDGISLLAVSDMKSLQTKAKEFGGGYFIGKDFAVHTAASETKNDLKGSGLRYLACAAPDTPIPSGYEKERALVGGCSLTNYVS
ncbi:hypothetical protein [Streptomyces puniciscabiei]|uniref:hypothetical protein n=1 Tax=Streptomyces puniciscabiei TaxID=164348 RepID=UPI003333CD54